MIAKRKILQMSAEGKVGKEDLVAVDRLVNVFVNGKYFTSLMASPRNLRELAIGHLFGLGIINTLHEIDRVRVDGVNIDLKTKAEVRFNAPASLKVIPSACGALDDVVKLFDKDIPKSTSTATFKARTISKALRSLHSNTKVFRGTGGTHAAALFTRGGKLKFCVEDVGRHNAVDKVIGKGLIGGVDFANHFIVLTGRLSADIAIKCARAGIPLVASKAAPLQSGILAAELSGSTLAGFVRGTRFNVYTHPARVIPN